MRKWLCFSILLFIWSLLQQALADDNLLVIHVRSPQSETDLRPRYYLDLLTATLEVTRKDFGNFDIQPVKEYITQDRSLWLLERNRVYDVIWTMTSRDREKQVRPIRIPLMKGLLGVRLLLISPEKLQNFSQVNDLTSLRKYYAVQGHDWPDTRILMANDIVVRTDQRYDELFNLVGMGRFDFFPRSVMEIYGEMAFHGQKDHLMIEPHLALVYPAPTYFFVNRDNDALANRLEAGLRELIRNGEFDRILTTHVSHQTALKSMQLEKRTIIKLKNPDLPPETPLDDASLWWDQSLFLSE
ncbi:hypothetical protein BTA51_00970 [Hahella sp. CCB-MM4]|uniref:transporter substrate-binding domain-containing protein n=1 Tax=Hahella sp. (strain CCB-MM4) TaxID=1926491 RepID=UPI000B9A199C|nr:transporter substrate-binding domain-containing protein [Hahella sp. CCB-MM4]OZG75004.1 hypothetical protein BTA51_00970 [Hahella sp. CCB-MM4]